MTLPRRTLVDPGTTPYYHCISRCVRRAFLCGADTASGRSFEHRRSWIRERLAALSQIFAIDVCAYAIMSNHHHLVLRLEPGEAEGWSEDEVLERWCSVFSGPLLVQRLRAGGPLSEAARRRVSEWAETYRRSLERAIPELLPFAGSGDDDSGLPFALDDYLELVDWSGRAIHPDKRGKIPDDIPPILQLLRINPDRLLRYLSRRERGFYLLIGRSDSFQQAIAGLGRHFFKGISAANRLFSAPSS